MTCLAVRVALREQVVERAAVDAAVLRGAFHRVRLARPRLPVREDARVVPVERALHHALDVRVHGLLRGALRRQKE